MVQDNTNLCVFTVAVPTTMGGTLVLRSLQGESVVIYMPLAPVSAIAVNLGRMLGGGLHLGVFEVSATLILLLMLKLLVFRKTSPLYLEVPRHHVQKASHPLFLVAPVPEGCVLVAMVTWTVLLLRH